MKFYIMAHLIQIKLAQAERKKSAKQHLIPRLNQDLVVKMKISFIKNLQTGKKYVLHE